EGPPAARVVLLGATRRLGAAQALGDRAQPALRHPVRGPRLLRAGVQRVLARGRHVRRRARRRVPAQLPARAPPRRDRADRRRDGLHLRRARAVLEHDRDRRAMHVRPVEHRRRRQPPLPRPRSADAGTGVRPDPDPHRRRRGGHEQVHDHRRPRQARLDRRELGGDEADPGLLHRRRRAGEGHRVLRSQPSWNAGHSCWAKYASALAHTRGPSTGTRGPM
ncbi:MAG: hypothetical protein AVDCRST_MAG85-1261, partial [uncultured Solirubrobacteraceae bacterium]